MSTKKHKKNVPIKVRIGVISVSTTRSIETDESGKWIIEQAKTKGHTILVHEVLKDDKYKIRKRILEIIENNNPDILLITGGTGLSTQDVTIEALSPIFSKSILGFGYMFNYLSYKKIGSAAIMSRASAGVIDRTAVFCMPGSKAACELACIEIIFPELGHIIYHIR